MPKKKINSRDKGNRGERYLAQLINHELSRWRYDATAERGQQRSGSPDSPDVKSPLKAQWEMKYGYNKPGELNLEEVYRKVRSETNLETDIPVVVWKKVEKGVRHDPLAIMRAEDAIRLLTLMRYLEGVGIENFAPFTDERDKVKDEG